MTDAQLASGNSTSKPTGRPHGSKNKRAPLKVGEIALEIGFKGFDKVKEKYGRSFTPKLACRVIEHMQKVGDGEEEIPSALQEFANKKRPGRTISGPMTAAKPGDSRPYTVSSQGRIGLSVDTIGGEHGKQVHAAFDEEIIFISKRQRDKDLFITKIEGGLVITFEPPEEA
jgi:hypothetical protein